MNTEHHTTTNEAILRAIAEDPSFDPTTPYVTQPNGHKFSVGETRTLTGLVSFPEYNGSHVKIIAIREDGERGKCYYIKGDIDRYLNWIYED